LRFFFNLLAVLNLADEGFRRLEAWNKVLVDDDRRVFRDVASDFLCPFLVYEASKAAHVDVAALGHRILHNFEEGFYGSRNICFFNAGLVGNFGDYFCFSHAGKCTME